MTAQADRGGRRRPLRAPDRIEHPIAQRTHTIEYLADLDNARLANLCGVLDENLRQIEAAFDVAIKRRGARFTIGGTTHAKARDQARGALEYFATQSGQPLSTQDMQLGLVELKKRPRSTAAANDADVETAPAGSVVSAGLRTRRADLHGRTPNQRAYLAAIAGHDITFGIGPAGTGKTYLAVAAAVDALERDVVQRIVLTRPAVEAGERLGFLPGDLKEKVDPYLRPLYDALNDMMPGEQVIRRMANGEIEVAPLAFMRGRTLAHSYAILDEAQNTTPVQMKMFLTRMGEGTRMVITGDLSQVDLPPGTRSGLRDALDTLEGVVGIRVVRFDKRDVVRHPLVAAIVDAYEQRAAAEGDTRRERRREQAQAGGGTGK